MPWNKILSIVYFAVTIIGGIILFNNSDNVTQVVMFGAVLVFSVFQNIYLNTKIMKLEKLNKSS